MKWANRFEPGREMMRTISCLALSFLLLLASSLYHRVEVVAPTAPPAVASQVPEPSPPPRGDDGVATLQITVGDSIFFATLYDNQAAEGFIKQLPLTLTMDELNGNEKFSYLSAPLQVDSYRPGTIKTGDLMLYGSDCLVLFYEGFSTSYSYTRLGFMEDASGLAAALGSGSAQVTFRLK